MIQLKFKQVCDRDAPETHVKLPRWLQEQIEARLAEARAPKKKSAKKDFRFYAFSGMLAGQEGVSFTEDCAPNMMYLTTRMYEEKKYAEQQAEKRHHLQDLLIDGIPDESLIERLLDTISHKNCVHKTPFSTH